VCEREVIEDVCLLGETERVGDTVVERRERRGEEEGLLKRKGDEHGQETEGERERDGGGGKEFHGTSNGPVLKRVLIEGLI
jgi:hypothetical protein